MRLASRPVQPFEIYRSKLGYRKARPNNQTDIKITSRLGLLCLALVFPTQVIRSRVRQNGNVDRFGATARNRIKEIRARHAFRRKQCASGRSINRADWPRVAAKRFWRVRLGGFAGGRVCGDVCSARRVRLLAGRFLNRVRLSDHRSAFVAR